MIFLIPVPLVLGSVAAFYGGRVAFDECARQGRLALGSPDAQVRDLTTALLRRGAVQCARDVRGDALEVI